MRDIKKELEDAGHVLLVCPLPAIRWSPHYWCKICNRVFFPIIPKHKYQISYWDYYFTGVDDFVNKRLIEDLPLTMIKRMNAKRPALNCEEINIREVIE